MNGTIDIRRNTEKNISSDQNHRFTGTSLKNDNVSTHKPRSHVAVQTLKTAGFLCSVSSCACEGQKKSLRKTVSSLEAAGKKSVDRKLRKQAVRKEDFENR